MARFVADCCPYATATNIQAMQAREPNNPALTRYEEMSKIVTDNPQATVADGVAWLNALCEELAVPGLATYGMTKADLPTLVEKSANASSMKGNPITLTSDELQSILLNAL